VQIQEHEALWARVLVTQARMNLAGYARLAKVVFDKGFLDGTTLWWLDQHGITFVVPAKGNMAGTADARAQAATGKGITVGRRAHTVRHGQGKTAHTERLETEVVGITGLTTYDQYGTPAHESQANRRDFQANPLNAVVVRQWNGKDYWPRGKTVFLTNASVAKPLQPFDDYDDRLPNTRSWSASSSKIGRPALVPAKTCSRSMGSHRVRKHYVRISEMKFYCHALAWSGDPWGSLPGWKKDLGEGRCDET
jgi:hypothetical protein